MSDKFFFKKDKKTDDYLVFINNTHNKRLKELRIKIGSYNERNKRLKLCLKKLRKEKESLIIKNNLHLARINEKTIKLLLEEWSKKESIKILTEAKREFVVYEAKIHTLKLKVQKLKKILNYLLVELKKLTFFSS